MRIALIIALIMLTALPASAAPKKKKPLRIQTEEEKTLYGVGLVIARQLEVFDLSPYELRLVQQGIRDGVYWKKARVDFAAYSKKSQELGIARRDARGKKLAAQAPAYMEQAEKEPGAVKTASGMIFIPVQEGTGAAPTDTDKVKVNYRGTLIDGKEVESTYKVGQSDEAEVKTLIKCMTEGFKMMKVGGKARLICPPELAYGKEGIGVIPPNATIILEAELLEIVKEPTPTQPQ